MKVVISALWILDIYMMKVCGFKESNDWRRGIFKSVYVIRPCFTASGAIL